MATEIVGLSLKPSKRLRRAVTPPKRIRKALTPPQKVRRIYNAAMAKVPKPLQGPLKAMLIPGIPPGVAEAMATYQIARHGKKLVDRAASKNKLIGVATFAATGDPISALAFANAKKGVKMMKAAAKGKSPLKVLSAAKAHPRKKAGVWHGRFGK